ncbi:MAG: sorbosone dehydrogenase family protein, partial [Chloroflexota bacterium]
MAETGDTSVGRSDGLEQLTGLRLGAWAALGALAIGTFLALLAASSPRHGRPASGPLLGVAAGGIVVAIVIGRDLGELARLPEAFLDRPISIVVAIGVIAVAFALVDVAYARGMPLLAKVTGGAGVPTERRSDAAVAVLAMTIAVVTLVGLVRLDRGSTSSSGPTAVPAPGSTPGVGAPSGTPVPGAGWFVGFRAFDLPAGAMAVTMRAGRSGYVSLDSGAILEFTLPADEAAPIELRTVLDGLDHPRGIAIRQGRLYVVERGPLPCAPEIEFCDAADINPNSGVEGEVSIMSVARARVSVYDVAADGGMGPASVIISGLPVSDALHTANDLTVGPDGLLYLAVGNVDYLFKAPGRANGITPHPEWLGTILRFDGSGAAPEVFAKGLRNVYQVAFDDQGRMWAIDNDGPTIAGWRGEELLQIKQGRNYGFPYEGTFGPRSVRDDAALWISRHKGNA